MRKITYIHYGNIHFDPTIRFPMKNKEHPWVKPNGGLWASRVNASFGWKDWCKSENFRDCDKAVSFLFQIKDESKVYRISTLEDLKKLPSLYQEYELDPLTNYYIDFEKCLSMGIDALELCWYGEEWENVSNGDLHFKLYGWDCDCILVLNPDAVMEISQ